MKTKRLLRSTGCLLMLLTVGFSTYATGKLNDTTRAYAVPTLAKTPKGSVAMSWTEKDKDGTIFFYWAESTDKGQTFGDKKLIHSSAGIGNSRLMRPKLLFKKDGSMVAVFSLRGDESPAAQASASSATSHDAHEHSASHQGEKSANTSATKAPQGGGRPRDSKIVYCVSKDQGVTWTEPAPVHSDNTPNIVRGFFDAIVLANGEIGVAYLNDIEGKAHQRDLRFVVSKGDRFGAEKILDPFVCDCCNISLLVDNTGTLQLFYRENQDNIRDIARMSSTDNGVSFSKPGILFNDNWQINGCPHSGPTSSASAGNTLIAWFSGTKESPGIRVVNQKGKRLFVLDDPTARNAYLVPAKKSSVLLWEQNQEFGEGVASFIAYKDIKDAGAAETKFVKSSRNGTNASGLTVDNQLLIAYEVRNANNKNSIEWMSVDLQ
ncbi:exo-alpha-sialidase [Spirosoma taeanense]|uniref:Exo-alpha-sialidase n=1 Tax=Spirosoma taeanense TaxID=2735870 RepID=A0A6M5Y8K1_9BACT|nr:exo-alpha-sialidase [Spirosoma taeanense]